MEFEHIVIGIKLFLMLYELPIFVKEFVVYKMCLRIVKFSPLSLFLRASLIAQLLKNLPAMQETWVRSLGWEDPQEKGMATHSSILAWKIPWTEEPGGLQSMGSRRIRHN